MHSVPLVANDQGRNFLKHLGFEKAQSTFNADKKNQETSP